MANLGTIGTTQDNSFGVPYFWHAGVLTSISLGLGPYDLIPFCQESTTDGNPLPSLLMNAGPAAFKVRWPLSAGTNRFSIDVKQVANLAPRPQVVVRANSAVGLNADIVSVAPSGAFWVTIGPITVNASALGGVVVELQNQLAGWYPCYWDNIVKL